MSVKRNTVAVIGLGAFGEAVARDLSTMGDRVVGIDIDSGIVTRFAGLFDSIMQADATDEKALKKCSIETYDAVIVSIGENTEASILAAMNVLELGCKRIWVKAQNDTHRRILEAIGVVNVVQPERAHGQRLAQIIHNPKLVDYLSLGEGQYVASVVLPEKYIGRQVRTLNLRDQFGITCVGIWRGQTMLANLLPDIELQRDDRLLLCGRTRDLRHFADR